MELGHIIGVKGRISTGQSLSLILGQYLIEIFFLGCALLHLLNCIVTVLETVLVHHLH